MQTSKPRLIMTVGLPRSGKSTILRKMNIPIVSPDEIRKYLGCFPYTAHMEPLVWCYAHMMVEVLFGAGCPEVALDATNITKYRRDEWKSDAWDRHFIVVATPKEICITRAREEGYEYLVPVIERMARESNWESEFAQPDFKESFQIV